MRKILMLLAAVVFTAGIASAQKSADADGNYVKVGEQVPSFTITMLNGKTLNINNLKGKVVLVNFWATWCPYCVQELTRFPEEIVKKYAGKDFAVVCIDRMDGKRETQAKVEEFMKAKGYKFPVGLDEGGKVFGMFATSGIPRNYVIGKDGKIAYIGVGYDAAEFTKLQAAIEEAKK
jgi:peroxiredoxin